MGLRSVFIVWISVLSGLLCSAQKGDGLQFFIGPESDEKRNQSLWEVFGHHQDYFLTLRSFNRKKGQFIIEKIDTDSLKTMASVVFKPQEMSGRYPVLTYPMTTKNACFLIATAEDPKGTDVYIMAYPISEGLKIPTEPIVLGIANREALLSENGFLIFKSKDEDKVALFVPEETEPQKNEKFTLRYFDANLSLLDARKVEIPYRADEVLLHDAVLSSNGDFHGIISLKSESEVRSLPDSYALISYSPEEDQVKEKALALGSKWFYELDLTMTPDTNLWLSGYYSNMVEPSMAGTFSVVINSQNGELLQTGLSPFDRDFRLIFRNYNRNSEDALGLFKLDDSALSKDGLISLISEKRYERQSTIFNPATGVYSTVQINYNEEILISTIKPNSQIVANVIIPKYQSYSRSSGRYASYVFKQWNDQLIFFYNEHIRNAALSPNDYGEYRFLNNENNMTISFCVVGKDKVVKGSIAPERIDNYYLNAEHSYSGNDFEILTAYKGYKTRYIKVTSP